MKISADDIIFGPIVPETLEDMLSVNHIYTFWAGDSGDIVSPVTGRSSRNYTSNESH